MLDASREFFLYAGYANPKMVCAAQLGREVHQHRNKPRGRNQNSGVIAPGLLRQMLKITWWLPGKDTDKAGIKSCLVSE